MTTPELQRTQHTIAVSKHQPNDDGLCVFCTWSGVGDNQGPVRWPCGPYQISRDWLRADREGS